MVTDFSNPPKFELEKRNQTTVEWFYRVSLKS